jgi:hypothetical protein
MSMYWTNVTFMVLEGPLVLKPDSNEIDFAEPQNIVSRSSYR